MAVCTVPGCGEAVARGRCPEHERRRQRARNQDRSRRELYDAEWERESREIRRDHPWCAGPEEIPALADRCRGDATTVDHPTRWALCRPCHGRLEAARRSGLMGPTRGQGPPRGLPGLPRDAAR